MMSVPFKDFTTFNRISVIFGIMPYSENRFGKLVMYCFRTIGLLAMLNSLIFCILAANWKTFQINETTIWINNYIANMMLYFLYISRMKNYRAVLMDLLRYCNHDQQKVLVSKCCWFWIILVVTVISQLLIAGVFLYFFDDKIFRNLYVLFNDNQALIMVIFTHVIYNIYVLGLFAFSIFFSLFMMATTNMVTENFMAKVNPLFMNSIKLITELKNDPQHAVDIKNSDEGNNKSLKFFDFNYASFSRYYDEVNLVKNRAAKSTETIVLILVTEFFIDTIIRLTFTVQNKEAQTVLVFGFYWLSYTGLGIFILWLIVLVDGIQVKEDASQTDLIDLISGLETTSMIDYDRKQTVLTHIINHKIPHLSCDGYFDFNKQLILSFASSVITFAVMVISLFQK